MPPFVGKNKKAGIRRRSQYQIYSDTRRLPVIPARRALTRTKKEASPIQSGITIPFIYNRITFETERVRYSFLTAYNLNHVCRIPRRAAQI